MSQPSNSQRVSVLGSGAWGTTLAQVLADAGHDVLIWGRNGEVVNEINNDHTNHAFLPGAQLPSSIRATSDIATAFEFGKMRLRKISGDRPR